MACKSKNKNRKVVRKQFVLTVYKNGRPVTKVKSINADYVIRKLKEQ